MIWLLGSILAPAQMPEAPPRPRGPEHPIALRLERGLELVYRGTFREQSTAEGVRHQRSFRVEARFLVLEATKEGFDVAALTLVQDRSSISDRPGAKSVPTPPSARLERLKVDKLGKILSPEVLVPIDGPPSLEVGPLVSAPAPRVRVGQGWECREEGRPSIAWQAGATEMVEGRSCVKLLGIQQVEEWERPRGDRGAWRRRETVWLDTRAGLAARVERVLEQRDPARREVGHTSTLRLDLESAVRQPAYLAEASRSEVARALAFRGQASAMLPYPATRARELAALQRAIARYMESQPATPYREAVAGVKRLVDAACKGEAVTVSHLSPEAAPAVAAVGREAPDFLASEITGTGTARLARWKGKPVLMVFYHPGSATAADLLRFAGSVHSALGKHVAVVGMSVSDDAAAVLKQLNVLKLTIPVLHGGGLRASYAVEATPKIVLIDAAGVVRGSYLGWGSETAGDVMADLRRHLGSR